MDNVGAQLVLVAILMLLNAAFAGSEVALLSLREGQLTRLEQRSAAGRVLAALAREPNRFLSTIQIGITLSGFLASATAAVALAEPLVAPLSFLGRAARPAAIFSITLVLTFVTLVFGELAPKRLAMQRAQSWGLAAARPLALLAKLMAPVIRLLSWSTDLTVRMFRGDPNVDRQAVTHEEIRDLIAAQPIYTQEQRHTIDGALEVASRTLRQIMIPRAQVIALSADTPAQAALRRLADVGHSRAPVFHDDLDDATLSVSVLALVGHDGLVGELGRPVVALPESLNAVAALRKLQAARQQLALVVSEHGGVEGIVTVEDLIEELVGEIYDEHDDERHRVLRTRDGSVVVAGAYPVHELGDLGIDVTATDATTVGGLIVEHLGRIPVGGDHIEVDGQLFEVLSVRRRVADRVRIRDRNAGT